MRLTTGPIIATTCVGQVVGMTGFVSFPALQPEFQRLWTLSDGEAGFISGIYFAGYCLAVPLASGLTNRVEARRVYLASLLSGVATALGFALAANGLASAALWRFLQGAAFGGAHMPGLRALSEAVPAQRQGTAIAVFTGSFTVGSSLSFALSGLLARVFGWQLGFALLALGPLAAAAIGFMVLPQIPFHRTPRHARAPLSGLLQNRRALRFIVGLWLAQFRGLDHASLDGEPAGYQRGRDRCILRRHLRHDRGDGRQPPWPAIDRPDQRDRRAAGPRHRYRARHDKLGLAWPRIGPSRALLAGNHDRRGDPFRGRRDS
jgi:MFS family permease